jgi:hypothetical protein
METSTGTLEGVGSDKLIRPFQVNFPQADLDDLNRRN